MRRPLKPAAPDEARPPRAPASTVNPEAGDYAITADPLEWAAAQAAARRSWDEFPYYPRRYGERGWRFTLSDSGWIATLCALPPNAVAAQVTWLQGLLVPRGMPSWLLEWHLVAIHEELLATTPDDLARYAVLAHAASTLRAERVRALPDARFHTLAGEFDAAAAALAEAVPKMGGVLLAAIVDEANGHRGALAAVTSWATDPAQFPREWRDAVEEFVQRARREVRRR